MNFVIPNNALTIHNVLNNKGFEINTNCKFGSLKINTTKINETTYYKEVNTSNTIIQYAIQTNATLLNEKWYQLFKENNFLVGVSLDGIKQTHNYLRSKDIGNYRNILEKIKQLEKAKIEHNILVVVTKDIALHPLEVYNNLKKEGIKYLQFIPCLDSFDKKTKEYSLTPSDYGYFLVTLFKAWKKDIENSNYISIRLFDNIINRLNGRNVELCSFNGKCSCQFVIEANGDVYPCDFYCIDKYNLGNIKTSSLKELFMSSNSITFLQEGSTIKEKFSIWQIGIK